MMIFIDRIDAFSIIDAFTDWAELMHLALLMHLVYQTTGITKGFMIQKWVILAQINGFILIGGLFCHVDFFYHADVRWIPVQNNGFHDY